MSGLIFKSKFKFIFFLKYSSPPNFPKVSKYYQNQSRTDLHSHRKPGKPEGKLQTQAHHLPLTSLQKRLKCKSDWTSKTLIFWHCFGSSHLQKRFLNYNFQEKPEPRACLQALSKTRAGQGWRLPCPAALVISWVCYSWPTGSRSFLSPHLAEWAVSALISVNPFIKRSPFLFSDVTWLQS